MRTFRHLSDGWDLHPTWSPDGDQIAFVVDAGTYKNLYLVVAPDNFRVKQSVIIDSSNNTNQFEFFAPDFEKAQKDTIFEFDERSVKNYRIIDADQQQQGSGSAAAPAPAALPPPAK